ncbi:MAG: hypothetical protein AAGM16_06810 [Pseudomonadota bacterium]
MRTRIILIALVLASYLAAIPIVNAAEPGLDVVAQKITERAISARDLESWVGRNLESLAVSDLLNLYSIALASDDPSISSVGIEGAISLLRISTSGGYTYDVAESSGLALIGDVSPLASSSDPQVRMNAIRFLAVASPDEFGREEKLVQLLLDERDKSTIVELIRLIGAEGVSTTTAQRVLVEIAESGSNQASHRALRELLSGPGEPPRGALKPTIMVIQSDAFFSDPNLVQYIPKFGTAAKDFLPELRELEQELGRELALSSTDRSRTIYNDSFYSATLRDAIVQIESL